MGSDNKTIDFDPGAGLQKQFLQNMSDKSSKQPSKKKVISTIQNALKHIDKFDKARDKLQKILKSFAQSQQSKQLIKKIFSDSFPLKQIAALNPYIGLALYFIEIYNILSKQEQPSQEDKINKQIQKFNMEQAEIKLKTVFETIQKFQNDPKSINSLKVTVSQALGEIVNSFQKNRPKIKQNKAFPSKSRILLFINYAIILRIIGDIYRQKESIFIDIKRADQCRTILQALGDDIMENRFKDYLITNIIYEATSQHLYQLENKQFNEIGKSHNEKNQILKETKQKAKKWTSDLNQFLKTNIDYTKGKYGSQIQTKIQFISNQNKFRY